MDWKNRFKEDKHLQSFANTVCHKLQLIEENLHWKMDHLILTAVDGQGESFVIHLTQPVISNSKGLLVQIYAGLNEIEDGSDHYNRLFKKSKYHLNCFGETIRFSDPIWGEVCLIAGRNTIIQRQIENKWFTYIPSYKQIKQNLHLNKSLFYDHALWINLNDPAIDIRICDLKTGEELYDSKQGYVYQKETGQQFCLLTQLKDYSLITQFEDEDYINAWMDPSPSFDVKVNDTLEFSRFRHEEGSPLTFKWNGSAWTYSLNSHFYLDTKQNVSLYITRFLPLINQEGKRKILIPCGEVQSKGYSPLAEIVLGTGHDEEKGSLRFFEYEMTPEGELIPHSLDSKIYLAHLRLAQKQYQSALSLIKTISINEKLSSSTRGLIRCFLESANELYDFSPNACAVRLHAYYVFKKNDPFRLFSTSTNFREIYSIYLKGLNNLEHALQLDEERELIEFLKIDIKEEKTFFQQTQELGPFFNDCLERESYLNTHRLEIRHSNSHLSSAPSQIQFDCGGCSFYISPENEKNQSSSTANEYFKDQWSSFLGKFEEFSRYYHLLKTHPFTTPLVQGIVYELLTAHQRGIVNNNRAALLLMVAKFPLKCPPLPSPSDSDKEKFLWYQTLSYLAKGSGASWGPSPRLNFPTPKEVQNRLFLDSPSVSPSASLPEIPSLSVRLMEGGQDVRFYGWYKRFLEKKETPVSIPDLTSDIKLKSSEEEHRSAIEKRLDHYRKDREVAYQNRVTTFVFKGKAHELVEEMEQECKLSDERQKTLKEHICVLIKRPPKEFLNFTKDQATLLGQARRDYSLETILRAASSPNGIEALIKLNVNLSVKEAQELRDTCIEWMIEVTYQRQINRVLKPLKKWTTYKKEGDLKKAELALRQLRSYDPLTNTFALFFEFLSGLQVRSEQASIINLVLKAVLESQDEKSWNQVFQLMMGGGKTSVIISMLIEIVSESGQLAWVLSHHSQLPSVKGNLASLQSKRFNKDIYVLDYSLEELSQERILDLVLKRIKEAERKKCAIVSKSSFPQVLESKWILESLREVGPKCDSSALDHTIKTLQEINQILSKNGVAFYDEVDILLLMLLRLHIPIGEPQPVRPERADLVKAIFKVLIDPQIKETIKLHHNLQAELSSSTFNDVVRPFVAQKIFHEPSLKLASHSDLQAAYERYVCDKISSEDQQKANDATADLTTLSVEKQENVKFLRHLAQLARSEDRYEKEAANLIALSRLILNQTLPTSLNRSSNRGYGRDLTYNDGRTIPYLAIDTPAITKFGNIYIALAYQFQTALNGQIKDGELTFKAGITKGEISFLAKKMMEAASDHAQRERIQVMETLEAKQFLRMTGISLDEVNSAEKLKQAWEYVNDPDHLERRLEIEAEVAPFHVLYHPQMISSNPINQVDQFNKSVACSGTPWNHSTYHHLLGKPHLELGTEGSILNLLDERSRNAPVHEVPTADLTHFFDLIRQHPKKRKLRGFIDPGALLIGSENEKVARQFMSFFAEEEAKGGPEIDAIIYLHKISEKEERFALLKRGATEPCFLKNTSKKEIKRLGVRIEHLFALFDESRTTGTDIPLAEEGFSVMTCDDKNSTRSILQAVLRARKLFADQEIEFIVKAKSKTEMMNEGQTFGDYLNTFAKNEAIMLKEHRIQSVYAQIDNVVRSAVKKELLEAISPKQMRELAKKYQSFLISTVKDEPYEQYGQIIGKESSINVFKGYSDNLLKRFEETNSPSFPLVQEKMAELFKRLDIPDEQISSAQSGDPNMTIELEQETMMELERAEEEEIELESEIYTELNSYQYKPTTAPYQEKPWLLVRSLPLWKQLKPQLLSMETVLNSRYKGNVSTQAYADCFPKTLWMTKNFYHTSIEELPVFNPYSKRAGFVLAVPQVNHDYAFLLISEQDAAFFKTYLKDKEGQGIYLFDIGGILEVHIHALEKQSKAVQEQLLEGIWYANFFNGNIDFLENHAKLSHRLIRKREAIMTRFLQLRAIRHPVKLNKLAASRIFDLQKHGLINQQKRGILFSDRRQWIEKKYHQARRLGPEEVAQLSPEEVENLASHQIPWLKKQEQIAYLPDELVDDLAPEQIPLLPLEKVPSLTKKELIQALESKEKIQQVNFKYISFIKEEHRPYLEEIEVILALPDDKGLSEEQKGRLKHHFFINQVEEGQLKSWYLTYCSDEILNTLSPNGIKIIKSEELFSRLTDNNLQLIDSQQLSYLKEADFKRVTSEKLLFKAPASCVAKLDLNQQRLLKSYIANQPEETIPLHYASFLTDDRIERLKTASLILALPLDKISLLKKDQIQLIPLKDFKKKFVEKLSLEALQALNQENYQLFCSWLSKDQVEKLDPTSHLGIIQGLTGEPLSNLSDRSLQFIKLEQVTELDLKTLKRLRNEDLLLVVSEEKVKKLAIEESWMARYKQAIQNVKRVEQFKLHHMDFLETSHPLLQEIDNPQYLVRLRPELFAMLSSDQLLKIEKERLSYEQINALPVEKLQHLISPFHIAMIGPDKIQQMTAVHHRQLNELTDMQIQAVREFPEPLVCFIPDSKLKALSPASLKYVPKARQKHLSDEQIKALYGPTCPSGPVRVLKGLALSILFLPRLIGQFIVNSVALAFTLFLAIFFVSKRAQLVQQIRETFIHAPARAFAGLILTFDYWAYQRMILAHES